MRLFLTFITFATTKYVLQTFVDSYKYHVTGLFLEILPWFILVVLFSFLHKSMLNGEKFTLTYFKLFGASFAGFIIAEAILFYQWYWFIAPEYRTVPGDMAEGLGFTIFSGIIWTIFVAISYFAVLRILKSASAS